MSFKNYLNEGTQNDLNIGSIKKLYAEMETINKQWTNDLDKALKSYNKELESLGYTKENDYTPDYEASDEEWSKYDKIETELNKKYKIGEINTKYSSAQDEVGSKIWKILQDSIKTVPALRPYKDVLTDDKNKFRIVNKFKDILLKIGK